MDRLFSFNHSRNSANKSRFLTPSNEKEIQVNKVKSESNMKVKSSQAKTVTETLDKNDKSLGLNYASFDSKASKTIYKNTSFVSNKNSKNSLKPTKLVNKQKMHNRVQSLKSSLINCRNMFLGTSQSPFKIYQKRFQKNLEKNRRIDTSVTSKTNLKKLSRNESKVNSLIKTKTTYTIARVGEIMNDISFNIAESRLEEIYKKFDQGFEKKPLKSKIPLLKEFIENILEFCIKQLKNKSLGKCLCKIISFYSLITEEIGIEHKKYQRNNKEFLSKIQNLNDQLIKKEIELQNLKKKYVSLTESRQTTAQTPLNLNSLDFKVNTCQTFSNKDINENQRILNINMNNLSDLDALYFFDKVDMSKNERSHSHSNVPMLSFGFEHEENNIKTAQNQKIKKIFSLGEAKKPYQIKYNQMK